MKNYDILYTNGCSFTRGDQLPREECWPELLSEKLNLPLIDNSRNAQSMGSILSKTMADILDYKDKKILAIIGLTWPDRYSLKFANLLINYTLADATYRGERYGYEKVWGRAFSGIKDLRNKEYGKDIRCNILYDDVYAMVPIDNDPEGGYIKTIEPVLKPYLTALKNIFEYDDNFLLNELISWYENKLHLQNFLKSQKNVDYKLINFQSPYDLKNRDGKPRSIALNAADTSQSIKYKKELFKDKNVLWVRDSLDIDKNTSHPSKEGCITLCNLIYDSINR